MKLTVFLLISVMSCVGVFSQTDSSFTSNLDLESKIRKLQLRLYDLEDTIAFYTHMENPAVDASRDIVIPFPMNITNVGDAYDSNNYWFMAPKSGIYAFYVKLDCTAKYRAFNLVKNDVEKFALAHNDVDDHSLGTFAIIELERGDKVDVRHSTDQGRIDGGPESFFSGWWLGRDQSYLKPTILPDLMI